jgi:hypothetical protein
MFDTTQGFIKSRHFSSFCKECMIAFLASDQLGINEIDLFAAVLK